MSELFEWTRCQQVEGFARLIACPNWRPPDVRRTIWDGNRLGPDFRGASEAAMTHDWWRPPVPAEPDLEWETAAVPRAVETVFHFVGESANLPENTYPGNQAALYVNGERAVVFDLGIRQHREWRKDDWALDFTPRLVTATADVYHRQLFGARGNSGVYRLYAPARALQAGQPLRIKVVLEPLRSPVTTWFAIRDRTDTLVVSPETNAAQIERLQQEIIDLKRMVGGLARHVYPELFPDHLQTEHVVVYTSGYKHVHVPDLVQLQNGDLLVVFREGSEHISCDGECVMVRSRDGGKTWGERQVLRTYPETDERDCSLTQLLDGTLLCAEWPNGHYDRDGFFHTEAPANRSRKMGMYVGRSYDNGYTWEWPEQPIDPAPYFWDMTTEHILELPSGRLLMANDFLRTDGSPERYACHVLASDDMVLTWRELAIVGDVPDVSLDEPALERTKSGRLVMMMRNNTGAEYYRSFSDDDGLTWTAAVPSGVPGHSNPASLLALPDDTVLCVCAQRGGMPDDGLNHARSSDPSAMYVVASYNDGETWDMAGRRVIRDDLPNFDMSYPSTVLLPDGRIFTVYYYNMFGRFFIAGDFFRWPKP
jgi:sialidase-1